MIDLRRRPKPPPRGPLRRVRRACARATGRERFRQLRAGASGPAAGVRYDRAALRRRVRDELRALAHDALEQQAVDDFHAFVRLLWPVLEPSTPFVDNWHIRTKCQEIQRVLTEGGDLVISEPPGYAKSLITSCFLPAFAWLQDPGERMLYIAGSDSLRDRDGDKSLKLVRHPIYGRLVARKILALRGAVQRGEPVELGAYRSIVKSDNPQPWGIDRGNQAKASHGTELGGFRWAFTYGAHITGERGRITVVDDPVDAKKVVLLSATRQAEVFGECVRVFDQVLESRGDWRRPVRIVIAQRLHEHDLPGVLARRPGWRTLIIPEEWDQARAAEFHPDDPRHGGPDGALAFPAVYAPWRVARRKRSWGSRQYAAQANQNPQPATGGMLDLGLKVGRELRWFDNPHELAHERDWRLLIVVDATFGAKGATSSFVAVQAWQIQGDRKRLLYQRRGRWGFGETEREIELLAKVFPGYVAIIIEAKANGPALIERLKGRLRKVEGADPKASKEGRAGILGRDMEAGEVSWPHPDNPWIPKVAVEYREIASTVGEARRRGERWAVDVEAQGSGEVLVPWIVLWEDELARFPGARDDQVDSSAMAVIVGGEWTEDALQRAKRLASAVKPRVTAADLFRRRR